MSTIQSRSTAIRGEFVRLYCRFIRNGQMCDPMTQPVVRILDSGAYQESSSSSSSSSEMSSGDTSTSTSSSSYMPNTGFGPFKAVRESSGIWYLDWYVPDFLSTGTWYDLWTFQWDTDTHADEMIFEFTVHNRDESINWTSPAVVSKVDEFTAGLMNDLENVFIYEAQHIPVYWEQGYPKGDNRTFNFAYPNWRMDPRVLVRINKRIVQDGFYSDYNGTIRTEWDLDPEDEVYAQYYFKYFNDEEILDFLNIGLYAMNSTPPASVFYNSVNSIPYEWKYGVLLAAASQALKRLVFGFNFQERAFVLSEDGAEQQRKIENFKALYTEYNETWAEQAKNVKTRKLPGMMQLVSPEYTLPGGRCLSSGSYINSSIDGRIARLPVEVLCSMFQSGRNIQVESNINGSIGMSPVSMIWRSGVKQTMYVKTGTSVARLSNEHLVFMPQMNDYVPVMHLNKGDKVLVNDGCHLRETALIERPSVAIVEPTYDIEVPETQNLVADNMVSHNSRWYRYMYKILLFAFLPALIIV
jgi:hypothetical protein